MPDVDEILRERLARPLQVDPPPLADLQRRAARRRQRRSALAAAGAVTVAVVVVAVAPGVPWVTGERDVGEQASGLRDGVLDAGTGHDGGWRVVVTREDGWCVKRVHATGEGGACGLATPGRLDEGSQFPTWDGEEYVVVVAGPAPPGTRQVEVTAQERTAVATVTEVEGRLFYSVRMPPGDGKTRIVAYDDSGAIIDEVTWPPVPDLLPAPAPGGATG